MLTPHFLAEEVTRDFAFGETDCLIRKCRLLPWLPGELRDIDHFTGEPSEEHYSVKFPLNQLFNSRSSLFCSSATSGPPCCVLKAWLCTKSSGPRREASGLPTIYETVRFCEIFCGFSSSQADCSVSAYHHVGREGSVGWRSWPFITYTCQLMHT